MLLPVMFEDEFTTFLRDARGRLRRALIGAVGIDQVDDAVAAALEWAWAHRDEVERMSNPVGYLFRVAQSRSRRRQRPPLLPEEITVLPEVEPGLIPALQKLPRNERIAVWLAHGCGWTHAEVADALGVERTTASTHVRRALARLREQLGVEL